MDVSVSSYDLKPVRIGENIETDIDFFGNEGKGLKLEVDYFYFSTFVLS
ncbi:unnamed protein product [Rhodiola kirilowii]